MPGCILEGFSHSGSQVPNPLLIHTVLVLRNWCGLQPVMIVALTAANAEIAPLTDFSDRVVPFTAVTWSCVIFPFLVLLAHEAAKTKPLLTNPQDANTMSFQISIMFFFFHWYVMEALLMPISLDFAESMGQSATMSGFFLSSSMIPVFIAIVVSKRMVSESNWDQANARTLILGAQVIGSIVLLVKAVVASSTVDRSVGTKQAVFWLLICLGQICSFMQALPLVPLMVMWAKITPNRERSYWSVWTQCARNGGFLVGPAVFAIISLCVKQGQPVAPVSVMAWIFFAQCIIMQLATIYIAMALPKALLPNEDEEIESEQTEQGVEELDAKQRQEIVKQMIRYGFLRYFQTASIEVSAIMLLEVSYDWPTESCGAVLTAVSFTSLLFAAFSATLMSRKLVSESVIFAASNHIALLGAIFLFDFGTGAAGLMIADALVYGCSSVSNGIAEGWGSKAAIPDTDCSQEAYQAWSYGSISVARFIAPMIARAMIAYGGRNVNAAALLMMVAMACSIVHSATTMVWNHQSEKAEARESMNLREKA
ncbi:unnamed protein product [Effrenium voratum]|uniref:Uncharacterized protein n=1 Tax=Effrenium voratum TaxID=2562239 RepID=A0AA36IKH8_9DINO|nr:unnamed protein product [Effrenium voratum]CAJ1456475.1 unnamed protein product [Effrenium voratum]